MTSLVLVAPPDLPNSVHPEGVNVLRIDAIDQITGLHQGRLRQRQFVIRHGVVVGGKLHSLPLCAVQKGNDCRLGVSGLTPETLYFLACFRSLSKRRSKQLKEEYETKAQNGAARKADDRYQAVPDRRLGCCNHGLCANHAEDGANNRIASSHRNV
jgi:hypothetical protein